MTGTTVARDIAGLIPVLETPFYPDGRIDVDGFLNVLDRQILAGADGVMFAGFASEFAKLTDQERAELETAMLSRTVGSAAFGIVSVSDHATRNAVLHAERARAAGADAINLLPPYQLSPSADEVFAHLSAVLEAAETIPVVIQLAPALTGAALGLDSIRRLAERHENLRAIKVETVQPGSSFPELCAEILEAWNRQDRAEAARLHARLTPYLAYWMQSVELIIQVEKTVSHRRGWIRRDHCRRPGRALDRYELDTIDTFLAEMIR